MMHNYELSDAVFKKYIKLVYEKTGINLGKNKQALLHSRVSKVLREREIDSFSDYYNLIINDKSGKEIHKFTNLISTNTTYFFRESQHYDFIKNKLHPHYFQNKKKIDVWCAAASTGEEPYSIIMSFGSFINFNEINFNMLATDIDSNVLSVASKGVYSEERVNDIPLELLRKHFQKGKNKNSGLYKIKEEYRKKIKFGKLNLIEPFPIERKFDFIFCRNVFIYFDDKTKTDIVNKMYPLLKDGGYLLIGHSETLNHLNHSYKYLQPATYQKKNRN